MELYGFSYGTTGFSLYQRFEIAPGKANGTFRTAGNGGTPTLFMRTSFFGQSFHIIKIDRIERVAAGILTWGIEPTPPPSPYTATAKNAKLRVALPRQNAHLP